MNEDQKKELLKNSGFKCAKCGYYSPLGEGLEINKKFNIVLCSVCNSFSPAEESDFKRYAEEKIDWQMLETFRKFGKNENVQKKGMIDRAKEGRIVSRPAFGYKMENGELVPAENADEVREIFEEFSSNSSLNQIAIKHNMSVNGIKKILKNFTYIGKVRFDSQIMHGNHKPIIQPELFNRVQKRFEQLNALKQERT